MKHDNDVLSAVWNALEAIAIKPEVTKDEMEEAVEWFMVHYYELVDPENTSRRNTT